MIDAQPQSPPTSWSRIARAAVVFGIFIAGFLILRRIPLTLGVIVVATLVAYGINPIIVPLSKKMPRPVAIALVFAGLIVVTLAGAVVIIPAIIEQLQNVSAHSGDYLANAQSWLTHEWALINKKLGGHFVSDKTTDLSGQLLGGASGLLKSAFGQLGLAVVSTADALVVGITGIVLSYYFLTNTAIIKESFLSFFPQRGQAGALRFTQELERVFGGYITGQLILSVFCGVFSFLGLKLIHADYALLLGVLTGFLYAIPYLGVTSAILLGALFGLLQSWETAIWSAVIILFVTRISDTLLVPKVMSKSVGVSPMGIMLAVFAGGELLGVWGLVLAIPAVALLKVLWTIWLQPWLTSTTNV